MHDRLCPKTMYSRDLFEFREISDNITETVQDRDSGNGRLTGNRMRSIEGTTPLPVTFSDLDFDGHGVSRGPSVIAELLVIFTGDCFIMNNSRLKREVMMLKLQVATTKGRENVQFTESDVSLGRVCSLSS